MDMLAAGFADGYGALHGCCGEQLPHCVHGRPAARRLPGEEWLQVRVHALGAAADGSPARGAAALPVQFFAI